jgi:hypothetical protein
MTMALFMYARNGFHGVEALRNDIRYVPSQYSNFPISPTYRVLKLPVLHKGILASLRQFSIDVNLHETETNRARECVKPFP